MSQVTSRSPQLQCYKYVCWCVLCLVLDLQDGGVMVENGQNDFVHVLPQTQVDLLLLLQSVDQLRDRGGKRRSQDEMGSRTKGQHDTQGPAVDWPHPWRHCQSQRPGTEPWSDTRKGFWPRTNSGWESQRSGRRSDPAAWSFPAWERQSAVERQNYTDLLFNLTTHSIDRKYDAWTHTKKRIFSAQLCGLHFEI